MSYQHSVELRPLDNWSAVTSAPPKETELTIEAGKLLEDLRVALRYDLDAANRTAAQLAALLGSNHAEIRCAPPARGGLAPWQQRKVRDYIERRLEVAIHVDDLARLVSLSPGYFCRAFKESFGDTPHGYIMHARIERAQKLMIATPDPLSQIALASGHSDQAHFSRRFRQEIGESPSAWRRRHAVGDWALPDQAASPVRRQSASL